MINLGIMKNTPIIIGDLHNPRIQNLREPSGFKVRKSEMESPTEVKKQRRYTTGRRSD